MDLRDAVALSLLPRLSRRALTNEFREALRRDEAPAGQADVTLDTLHQRLGCNEPGLRAAIRRARGLAERALGRGRVVGVEPIPLNDSRYPDALAAVPDPPPVLWVRGQIAALATPSVAIVGSRAGSPYALEVARRLGADLAERGVTVVSGLARGVDSAAHRGALAASGRTVAVLGSGVDIVYPPEHAALAAAITTDGARVSELVPGTPPRAEHFPARNRIISGLSLAILVIEASERSGSLITARCGLEQGREVMAVPGSILTGRNRGAHALLRDGAKVVESVDDILEEIRLMTGSPGRSGASPNSMSDDPLLAQMMTGESYDLDALVALSGLDGATLLPRLLGLELKGLVARAGGGRFVRSSGRW